MSILTPFVSAPSGLGDYLASTFPLASPVHDYLLIGDQLTFWDATKLGPLNTANWDAGILRTAKAAAVSKVSINVTALRDFIAGSHDPSRLMGWKQQADDCTAFTAGIVTANALARIDAALSIRQTRPGKENETRQQFAEKTLIKAHRLAIASNQVNELQNAADEMIAGCENVEQIQIVVQAIEAKSQAIRVAVIVGA